MSNATATFSPPVLAGSTSVEESPYNYIPTQSVAIIFVVFFGLSTLLHVGQALFFRIWWLLPTACLAGTVEVLGWSGRLWSSINPDASNPFLIQITSTIMAPTPLVAANFIILGRIIQRLGPQYSRLGPKKYAVIFCSFDVACLLIQGVGGGIASSNSPGGGTGNETLGGNIMLAGIILQMAAISIYALLATEFLVRYSKDHPFPGAASNRASGGSDHGRGYMDKRLKLMSFALAFNTLCLFIRAVYRTIELSDGWTGRIISTQVYFNVLDGGMVVLAIYTLNIAHPGLLLGSPESHMDKVSSGFGDKGSSNNSKAALV